MQDYLCRDPDHPCGVISEERGEYLYCFKADAPPVDQSECLYNGGFCIFWQEKCPEGFYENSQMCNNRSEKCCLRDDFGSPDNQPDRPDPENARELAQAMNRLSDILERFMAMLSRVFGIEPQGQTEPVHQDIVIEKPMPAEQIK